MDVLFGGVRAPSALGSHLRCYTWGNVAQLEKAGREFLAELTGRAPLLPGAETLAFVDIDSMQKRVYGHKKQGARFGHTKIQGKSLLVRGLNALAAIVSTPLSAPVIAATRLRGGNAASARGAASLATQAVHQAADPRRSAPIEGAISLQVRALPIGICQIGQNAFVSCPAHAPAQFRQEPPGNRTCRLALLVSHRPTVELDRVPPGRSIRRSKGGRFPR